MIIFEYFCYVVIPLFLIFIFVLVPYFLLSQNVWKVGDSIVKSHDDARYNGIDRVNECQSCNLLYSNYYRFRTYPCPRCGNEEAKREVNVRLYHHPRNLFLKWIPAASFWQKVDNFGNPYDVKAAENQKPKLQDLINYR